MTYFSCVLALVLINHAAPLFQTPYYYGGSRRSHNIPLPAKARSAANHCPTLLLSSKSSEDAQFLKDSAARLRQEVEDLESQLEESSRKVDGGSETVAAPPSYASLKDSYWKITYRFSSKPLTEEVVQRRFYSGTVLIHFKRDGYTDLISQQPTGPASETATFSKFWGWDEEVSQEDGKNYVLFSASIKTENEESRVYFQAEIDTSTDGALDLVDGTVTIKQDIKPPGGFWGVFNGGGILAQFRNVGNFVQKPVAKPEQ